MPELDAWYKVTSPQKEVREGRSFKPDEFAIHLEQVGEETRTGGGGAPVARLRVG